MTSRPSWLLALFLVLGLLVSEPGRCEAWNVTQPRGPVRIVDFTTDEGTNMSVDISPDGRTILFDLMGHIYVVDHAGGSATSITQDSGVALNYHPRFSPDGRTIVFVSDRTGQDNLWLMSSDGRSPRPLLIDPDSRASAPRWSADGRRIVFTRHLPTAIGMWRRSERLWSVDVATGQASELKGSETVQYDWASPAATGDIYFMASDFTGSEYGQQTGYRIGRLAPDGGVEFLTAPETPVAEIAPEVSPDGRYLAFARQMAGGVVRYRGHEYAPRTALWLRDLRTGDERMVLDPITTDVTPAHAMYSLRPIPGYAWTRDSRSIVISTGGKLRKLDVRTGALATIEFKARVQRAASRQARAKVSIPSGDFRTRFVQWPTATPASDLLAFSAVNRLWLMSLPSGAPYPAVPDQFTAQLTPAWSADGKQLAFVTWSEAGRGHLWRLDRATGRATRLTTEPGEYLHPCWSPDGASIFMAKGPSRPAKANPWAADEGWSLVRLRTVDGSTTVLQQTRQLSRPTCGSDGRIYFQVQDPTTRHSADRVPFPSKSELARRVRLKSVDIDGGDVREHLTLPAHYDGPLTPTGYDAQYSPDGKRLALAYALGIRIRPAPGRSHGEPVPDLALDAAKGAPDSFELDPGGGLFHRWRQDGRLEFASGDRYIAFDPVTGRKVVTKIDLSVPQARGRGRLALTGARLITMRGEEVIESGSVVIEDDRIVCVGECDIAQVDRVVDVAGKTILPGLIDVHAHFTGQPKGVVAEHQPAAALYLSHGVTTARDPAAESTSVFPLAELVEAGFVASPRVFSSGEVVRGWGERIEIGTLDDARRTVGRLADWGAVVVKNYRLNRRDQQQMLIEAASERGLAVTSEGGDLFTLAGMALDGQTGWEHPIMALPIYKDAAQFFGQLGMFYSPTVTVAGHGEGAAEYFRPSSAIEADARYRLTRPWRELARNADLPQPPLRQFSFPIVVEGLADIIAAGGRGAIGDHSAEPGVGSHWEIWSYATALGNLDALRVATLDGAAFLGLDHQIGSLEPGKLADLIVLDGNPLEDIRQTRNVRYVMRGGRMFEADTLDQIWPDRRPFGDVPGATPYPRTPPIDLH